MNIDNSILRQMSVGLDNVRNTSSARKAEPDAFGQLFASMTQQTQRSQGPQSAQGGAAESASSVRSSRSDGESKIKADEPTDDTPRQQDSDDADVVTQSAAGAAAAQSQQVKDRSEKDATGGDGQSQTDDVRTTGKSASSPQAGPSVETTSAPKTAAPDESNEARLSQATSQAGETPVSQQAVTDQMNQSQHQQITDAMAASTQSQNSTDAVGQTIASQTQAGAPATARQQVMKATSQKEAAQQQEEQTQPSADAKLQTAEKPQASSATASQVAVNGAGSQQQQSSTPSNDQKQDAKPAPISAVSVNDGISSQTAVAAHTTLSPQLAGTGAAQSHVNLNATNFTFTDAEAQQIAQQALGSVRSMAAPGSGQGAMTLRLNPPELGALRISVRMDGPMLSATFEASNASVSSLLQSQMHALRSALERAGLGVEQLNVQSPSPLPSPTGSQFASTQQQMHQSPSDGRSKGMFSDSGSRQQGGQPQRGEQTTTDFQRELLDLVA